MEKILITGTGRCGTTFLIKLFSFLGFDTGFDRNNYKNYISSNCNSGMERKYNENFYVLKNPTFMNDINIILKDRSIKIKYVIIPIRQFKASAISRTKHGDKHGGLWNAKDELSQIQFYKKIFSKYIYFMNKYKINTIFIDFDKMINDKNYLFNKLKIILDEKNIHYDIFCDVYEEVSLISKP
jgi:hypothetical protein